FLGNEHFDDSKLREQMLLKFPSLLHPLRQRPRYQRNVFPKEMRRIEAFYLRQGFGGACVWLDSVMVVQASTNMVRLRLRVREGLRTILRDVRYSPQQVMSLQELRRVTPISRGDPYPFGAAQRGRVSRALRLAFLARGYLAVGVRDSTLLTPDSTEAVLIFKLDPGPRFKIRAVTVAGNRETNQELIRRELRVRPGEVYSYTRLRESEQNLYTTRLFRRVTIREENIVIERRAVDIAVRVMERKMSFVEGSVGFGRRDEYEARLIGRWGHRNLFGRGHALEVQSTLAYNIEKTRDNFFVDERVRYVNPHLFGTQIRLEPQAAYSIDRRIEDVELKRSRVDVQAVRKGGRFTTLSLGAFAAFTTTTLEESTDDLLETRAFSASIQRNSSDNIFDPRRGEVRTLSVQRAGFRGDNHFSRITGSYARYLSFGRWVLALGVRTGWVESFGASREASKADIGIQGVPFEYLFQAGGNTTVRGFDNNSLGAPITTTRLSREGAEAVVDTTEVQAGTVLLIGNVELRVPVPWLSRFKLGGVVFLDAGNVWSGIDEMTDAAFGIRFEEPYKSRADLRYSYGFGLRYATPFGPVRVDLGLPLKKFGQRKIHLGLGHTF
ncbi:MAG: outer membrane protein assembly factor, partial [Candidatus Krumholzibacteriia bacterium]